MVSVIISIIVAFVLFIIFTEYRNEKKYQEERRQNNLKRTRKRTSLEKKHTPLRKKQEIKLEAPKLRSPEKHVSTPPKTEKTITLPQANHPRFNHARLVDIGLSDVEAKEFVAELIPQIETQIPLIKEAMRLPDFHQMERLTHNIKGSATNIGIGGVSDLLVEFNTYLKNGTDVAIAEAYFKQLIHYTNELKVQYT